MKISANDRSAKMMRTRSNEIKRKRKTKDEPYSNILYHTMYRDLALSSRKVNQKKVNVRVKEWERNGHIFQMKRKLR